ncbi:MAG: DegQ family serine endoprotease [Burkholderiales bacterium]
MIRLLASILLLIPAIAGAQLPDFTELVDKQGQAVVNVSTSQTVKGMMPGMPNIPEDDPMFEFFRRFMPPNQPPREQQSRSQGSGFIISGDGYILTNAHVVDGAEEITVKFTDKREFKAKVIGADKRTDVALIKIDAQNLNKVNMGDPSKLRVGEWVVAIGSPFGFENSVTAGIVSAKGRSLPQENFVPFIQTDVAINPGNSGGPLFNLKGEVVGINSQIYSRTGGFMGLSFAIPIDVAMDIANQLKTMGKVTRGRIGVVIQEVTKELAESFGMPKPQGALVNSVEKGGPADKAGVEASDVIVKFDGKPVSTSGDLPRLVGATRPGSKAMLQVWRKGQLKDLTVTVAELQEEKVAQKPTKKATPEVSKRHGMSLSDLSAEQRKELGLNAGVFVEDAQGPAAKAGIRQGDVILSIGSQEVKSAEQFNQLVGAYEKGKTVALLIRRGESQIFITLKLNGG